MLSAGISESSVYRQSIVSLSSPSFLFWYLFNSERYDKMCNEIEDLELTIEVMAGQRGVTRSLRIRIPVHKFLPPKRS